MKESRDQIRQRARALASAEREFWEGLVSLREHHNLTQAQVAERMGVSQSAVARLERYDSNPTMSTIRRYALAVEARLSLGAYSDHAYASVISTASNVG